MSENKIPLETIQVPVEAQVDVLVTPHDAGRHNQDLENSRLRVIRGGSWKKQDIIVLVPAASMVPTKVAMSWWNLIFPPNNGVIKIAIEGAEVGKAYSEAIENIINHPQLSKFKYILTLEHDNIPPPGGVLRLLESMEAHPEFSVISGLYWTKGEGGQPQIWGDAKDIVKNYRPQPPAHPSDPNQLVECWGTGMGFVLWRLDMFKDSRLRRPWFKTVCDPNAGVGTQDLYFADDAKKNGYRFAVDCKCLVGHHDHGSGITW
jgi:hypothetical protein